MWKIIIKPAKRKINIFAKLAAKLDLNHPLVPVLLEESEGIVVAKVLELDQGVLAPTFHNGLSNTNFRDVLYDRI